MRVEVNQSEPPRFRVTEVKKKGWEKKEVGKVNQTKNNFTMAQENSDMSTKFSTLNVNAAEFVPSFGSFSAAASNALNNDNAGTPPTVTASVAPMDTTSVPASASGTPATTPNSDASVSGSLNALNQAGDVPPAESPMQTSPIKTVDAIIAAPVENILSEDKIAINNGKKTHTL